jgi:pimeloyl-ACP methyl ester carboxylesterase
MSKLRSACAVPVLVFWLSLLALAQEPSLQVTKGLHTEVYDYLTEIARADWTQRDARVAAIHIPAEVEQRQAFIRSKITELLGGFPSRTPLNAKVTGGFSRDGYRVETLVFESRPKFYVTADVYVPTSTQPPFPAVVGVAGHTQTSKAAAFYQHGWISLAKRGFLVIAFDPPGQGERIQYYDPELGRSRVGTATSEHTAVGLQCILTGSNVANYIVWDGMRAIDYLLTRNDVDPKRIAVAGNSGGGMQSAYLAALDTRLAAAAPSCFLTSSKSSGRISFRRTPSKTLSAFLRAAWTSRILRLRSRRVPSIFLRQLATSSRLPVPAPPMPKHAESITLWAIRNVSISLNITTRTGGLNRAGRRLTGGFRNG